MKLIRDLINESFEDIPSDKGYYTWWFTKDKTEFLLSKINRELNEIDRIDFSKLKKHPDIDYYALYFGIACGTAGLKQRIKWHTAKINGHTKNNVSRGTLSTLRQTICGLNEWDMVVSSDNVDDFLSDCYWEWVVFPDSQIIKNIEQNELKNDEICQIIKNIESSELKNKNKCYPLNIQGNETISKECRKLLKRLRKKYRNNG